MNNILLLLLSTVIIGIASANNTFLSPANFPICENNPFTKNFSTDAVQNMRNKLLNYLIDDFQNLIDASEFEDHRTFNIHPPIFNCPSKIYIGGENIEPGVYHDGAKWVCHPEKLQPGCVVYSLGSDDDFSFEEAILRSTPCDVVTLDCTIDPRKIKLPSSDRIKFVHICVSNSEYMIPLRIEATRGVYEWDAQFAPLSTVAAELGHTKIDILKMDIEGFEYNVFRQWTKELYLNLPSILPNQILFELHFRGCYVQTENKGMITRNYTSATLAHAFRQLTDLGYTLVNAEDNARCVHCKEFTAVRTFCPNN